MCRGVLWAIPVPPQTFSTAGLAVGRFEPWAAIATIFAPSIRLAGVGCGRRLRQGPPRSTHDIECPVFAPHRRFLIGDDGPAVLGAVNRQVHASSLADRCATSFYGVLDGASRTLRYVDAGHNPAMVVRDSSVRWLDAGGLPLGIFADSIYDERLRPTVPRRHPRCLHRWRGRGAESGRRRGGRSGPSKGCTGKRSTAR